MIPESYLGAVMELCRERRGAQTPLPHRPWAGWKSQLELPLAEVLFDFYDHLKTSPRATARSTTS